MIRTGIATIWFSLAMHSAMAAEPVLLHAAGSLRGALTEVQATPAPEGAPNVTLTRTPTALHINIEGGVMRAPADIWLLSVDPGPLAVAILYGENANRVMIHYNLVRRIRNVGTWRGAPMSFDATHCLPQCAVLVQNQNGGRILAAAMTRHSQ